MAEHLYTFAVEAALPDPAGLPEGYPVIVDGTLYALQDGAWIEPLAEPA